MKEFNHRWVISGRNPRIFGLVSPLTFFMFVALFFYKECMWIFCLLITVDLLERFARMAPIELARRLLIMFGSLFSYRRSRELGSSYRSRLWTYHFGHNIGDGLFFGIFHPLTILSIFGGIFFYCGVLLFRGYGVGMTEFIKSLCQLMMAICLLLSIALLIRDIWVKFESKSE